MSKVQSFRDLEVWQAGMELAECCYSLTAMFPSSELYGLTSQLRRAAVSIVSNIAEGHQRPRQAYLNHIRIASGSAAELSTQLELAIRLRFVTPDQAGPCSSALTRVSQVLHGLSRSLERAP